MTLPRGRMTYKEYLNLPDDERYELVEGELLVTPSPLSRHQKIQMRLAYRLMHLIEGQGLGTLLASPMDVVLSETTVLQPDLLFINRGRDSLIGERGVHGAPDLVVEILSPSTAERDLAAVSVRHHPQIALAAWSASGCRLSTRRVNRWTRPRTGGRVFFCVLPCLDLNTPEGFRIYCRQSERLRIGLCGGNAMENLTITILDEKGLDSQRVTIASDAEAGQVIANLVRLMEMPTKNPDGTPIVYALRLERTGLQISGVRTMAEFGVCDGDVLRLGVKAALPTTPDLPLDPDGLVNPRPRPWRRYWARFFDNYVFGLPIGIIVGLAAPGLLQMPRLLVGILVQPVVYVLEACLLATIGTTLGKALFNVSVRKVDGNRPTLGEATVRAFSVWAMGLGLGIPIVSLFTCINGYKTLSTEGTTAWDRSGGFRVTYGEIGPGRIILIMLFVVTVLILQFV